MFSTQVVLLQLLWLSVASASHFDGKVATYTARKISSVQWEVKLRNRATFRGCRYLYGTCRQGNCGHNRRIQRGIIDTSPNAPTYGDWCQTESVVIKILTTNKPFATRDYSCCWVRLDTPSNHFWSALTAVDLGMRSDTNAPNNSPSTAIVPFLRTPRNCPRTYRPLFVDSDGDVVRCRYGNGNAEECADCRRQQGFTLNEATCTLQYRGNGVYGAQAFELVVEDFPRNNVMVTYSDGRRSYRRGSSVRRKRWANMTTWPTTTTTTTHTTTTAALTTTHWQWWLAPTTTTAYTTTTAPTTTHWQWWLTTTTTAVPTTTSAYTTTGVPTTPTITTAYTTTAAPTTSTTTTAYTTTAAPTTTTTTTAYTTTAAPTTPTTTTAYTTTAAPTTPTTTTAYTTTSTTHAPTTTTHPWTTTTAIPTTTPWRTSKPFSRLPFQFIYRVDPNAPSCMEGKFIPRLVSPTPHHGEWIRAEDGKEVEIQVKAVATHSVADHIIMSGPLNITKHKNTGNVFTIKWTPTHEDLGHYFPICFAVEFKRGSAIYQSEMRCVVVNVTDKVVKTDVTCKESSMIVEVEKATLPPLRYDHLSLSDPSNTVCSLQTHSNSTHVVAIVPLNSCGTKLDEDDDNLIFKNEITTVDNPSAVVTRRHEVEIKFKCQYAKKGNVTFNFQAHREKVSVWDKGFGTFTYVFEFFPDQSFRTMIDPRQYPLEYDVGNHIFLQIEAQTTVNNTELFVESCVAAPYDTPNAKPTYTILENGCKRDSTLTFPQPDHKRQFRMKFEAFKFIGLHDQVYISCSVMMCEAGTPGTRCSKGCMSGGSRRKREAAIESGIHLVSQGPLRLKRSVEATGSTGLNLNLNLVFITGCALAIVGMICGVIFYKTKKSTVKYQPLPSEEK